MPKLPVISSKRLISVLEKMGFRRGRSRGSHLMMIHRDGRRTVVPTHGRDMPKGTLFAILKDLNISSKEDLASLL
ncbi:MAG: type II toxin-antitoxin system HicA family toxin [Candidatus Andersenbacteria bacterium]|nr:type II toxin-antitoxin system HicA family toxin [Candidatus Andersenbacteria bacterium]